MKRQLSLVTVLRMFFRICLSWTVRKVLRRNLQKTRKIYIHNRNEEVSNNQSYVTDLFSLE